METNEKNVNGDLDFMYRVVLSGWMGVSLTILTITLITGVVYLTGDTGVKMDWMEYAKSIVSAIGSFGLAFFLSKKYKAFV